MISYFKIRVDYIAFDLKNKPMCSSAWLSSTWQYAFESNLRPVNAYSSLNSVVVLT